MGETTLPGCIRANKDIPNRAATAPLLSEKSPTRLLVTSGTEVAPPEQAGSVTLANVAADSWHRGVRRGSLLGAAIGDFESLEARSS